MLNRREAGRTIMLSSCLILQDEQIFRWTFGRISGKQKGVQGQNERNRLGNE